MKPIVCAVAPRVIGPSSGLNRESATARHWVEHQAKRCASLAKRVTVNIWRTLIMRNSRATTESHFDGKSTVAGGDIV